jgi:hypothetical protein
MYDNFLLFQDLLLFRQQFYIQSILVGTGEMLVCVVVFGGWVQFYLVYKP